MQKIELDTKYSIVVHDDGRLEALRYNEPLVDLTGNEFIWAIVGHIDFLQNNLEGAQHWCCELEGAVADAGFDIEESNNLESHPFPLKLVVKGGCAAQEAVASLNDNGSVKRATKQSAPKELWGRKLTRGERQCWAQGFNAAHAAAVPMFDYQDVLGSAAAAEAIRDAGELLRTPAAPGVDLEQFRPFVTSERERLDGLMDRIVWKLESCLQTQSSREGDLQRIEAIRIKRAKCDRLLSMIDANPKGNSYAVVREYIAAQDAYEEAIKLNSGFASPKKVVHGDPAVIRYRNARIALNELLATSAEVGSWKCHRCGARTGAQCNDSGCFANEQPASHIKEE